MRETNVLFIWNVREDLRYYLHAGLSGLGSVNLFFPEDTTEESFLRLAPDMNIIVGWRPSRHLLDAAQRLKLFINPGVGVQHLIETFREINQTRNVTLVNGHGNTYFTAQHAVAMLLALTNKIIPHHNWMVEGKWRKGDSDAKSIPLRDLNIGLLGYGAVNQKVHRFLSGFDLKFKILKRSWSDKQQLPTESSRYGSGDLDGFLKDTDILIIAVPQTDETIGLIGKDELELLGSQGLLVNISRGPVIDEEALYHALSHGVIAGAAIDVWYNYQPEPDVDGRKFPTRFPFHELDNIVLSPHRGASPMDDLKRWDEVIENIRRFAEGRDDFINAVHLDIGY